MNLQPLKPGRGEIWRVQLDPVRGSEQAKTRPVLVLSVLAVGRPSVRLCVPLMGAQPQHAAWPWCIPIAPAPGNGLTKPSTADVMQTRALDTTRFLDRMGWLEAVQVDAVAAALALCVGHTTNPSP